VSDIHAMAEVLFPWKISKQDTHLYLVMTYKVLILEQKISGFLGQCTVYQYILGFRVSSENFFVLILVLELVKSRERLLLGCLVYSW